MNYKSVTIRQTKQVKQYEPIIIELTVDFEEQEDPVTVMQAAHDKIQEFWKERDQHRLQVPSEADRVVTNKNFDW